MQTLKNFMQEKPDLFAATVAALLLAGAFGFQAAGYHPCEMCWWQRYPYMAIIAWVAAARLMKLNLGLVAGLCAGLFAIDAGLAGFHAGVEQKWWEGITTCTADLALDGNLEDALDAIMNAPVVRCDEIAWSLFGISMAGYNFFIAAVMTVITGRATIKG